MKNPQVELARKVMRSLKKHWMKTNPHARIVMNYLKEKYGELPRADHMAIRSISGIGFGIQEANSLFSALGYRFGALWPIPKLNINACHFEPPVPGLEKIFFSVIELDDIETNLPPEENFKKIKKNIKSTVYNVSDEIYDICEHIHSRLSRPCGLSKYLIDDITGFFCSPVWIMKETAFLEISKKPYLQETAHVLAHGFIPNHFTFLMKDPNYAFPGYTSMEALSKEIGSLGIKMQEQVEGDEDSTLCQVSTKAYSKSYIEFIKRGADPTSLTGRYEGFLPNQAQVLFKMTAPMR